MKVYLLGCLIQWQADANKLFFDKTVSFNESKTFKFIKHFNSKCMQSRQPEWNSILIFF